MGKRRRLEQIESLRAFALHLSGCVFALHLPCRVLLCLASAVSCALRSCLGPAPGAPSCVAFLRELPASRCSAQRHHLFFGPETTAQRISRTTVRRHRDIFPRDALCRESAVQHSRPTPRNELIWCPLSLPGCAHSTDTAAAPMTFRGGVRQRATSHSLCGPLCDTLCDLSHRLSRSGMPHLVP